MDMTVRFGGATVKEVRRAGQRGQVRLIPPSTACCPWARKWPACSPDDNPLEHLWKNMAKRTTPHRYLPEFALLCASVEEGLAYVQGHPTEVQRLMGTSRAHRAGPDLAA